MAIQARAQFHAFGLIFKLGQALSIFDTLNYTLDIFIFNFWGY